MNPRDFLLALCVVVIWGFNFVAIKLAVTEIPPLTLSFLRFTLTALILLPFFRIDITQFKSVFFVGIVLGIGHFGFLMVGLSGADAATTALLIQLGVPFNSILAAIFFKDKLGWKRSLGMGLAFGGAALLVGEPQGGTPFAIFILFISAFCWAWANVLIKKINHIPPLAIIGWMGLFASPFIAMLSFILEDNQLVAVQSASLQAWAMLGYTICFSSLLAYHIWYSLIGRLDVNQVVPFTMLAPVIGVAAGVTLLGEAFTIYKIIGGLLTLCGVGIIQLRQGKKTLKP